MKITLRTALAATGVVAGLLAGPAMAQPTLAEQQRVARILADQGYSGVSFTELDRDVIVLARRDGSLHSFAYANGNGWIVPVGMRTGVTRAVFSDGGRDGRNDLFGYRSGGDEDHGWGRDNRGDR
jgi:hypothetical protein